MTNQLLNLIILICILGESNGRATYGRPPARALKASKAALKASKVTPQPDGTGETESPKPSVSPTYSPKPSVSPTYSPTYEPSPSPSDSVPPTNEPPTNSELPPWLSGAGVGVSECMDSKETCYGDVYAKNDTSCSDEDGAPCCASCSLLLDGKNSSEKNCVAPSANYLYPNNPGYRTFLAFIAIFFLLLILMLISDVHVWCNADPDPDPVNAVPAIEIAFTILLIIGIVLLRHFVIQGKKNFAFWVLLGLPTFFTTVFIVIIVYESTIDRGEDLKGYNKYQDFSIWTHESIAMGLAQFILAFFYALAIFNEKIEFISDGKIHLVDNCVGCDYKVCNPISEFNLYYFVGAFISISYVYGAGKWKINLNSARFWGRIMVRERNKNLEHCTKSKLSKDLKIRLLQLIARAIVGIFVNIFLFSAILLMLPLQSAVGLPNNTEITPLKFILGVVGAFYIVGLDDLTVPKEYTAPPLNDLP